MQSFGVAPVLTPPTLQALPIVLNCWPAVALLAVQIEVRGEVTHDDVACALGLSKDRGAKVVSFRDAQARARELEYSDDAAELYESAKRSGDTILAAAVLEKALVQGWSSIKEDYLERHTTARGDLDDLGALAKYGENPFSIVAHYMRPSLNLPHPAGFPDIPDLHASRKPQGVRPLADEMGQRLGLRQ